MVDTDRCRHRIRPSPKPHLWGKSLRTIYADDLRFVRFDRFGRHLRGQTQIVVYFVGRSSNLLSSLLHNHLFLFLALQPRIPKIPRRSLAGFDHRSTGVSAGILVSTQFIAERLALHRSFRNCLRVGISQATTRRKNGRNSIGQSDLILKKLLPSIRVQYTPLANGFKKAHARCHRNIQTIHTPLHGNFGKVITTVSSKPSYPATFRSNNKSERSL